ncbi:MAG: hypothetical protein RI947_957, partial [Candidatus Parcubacteria bacterium]
VFTHNDAYDKLTVLGRGLSGIFDLMIILFLYKILKLFEEKYDLNPGVKYWSCFLYAIAVLPIQLAHFFAVDTFLSFFMIAAFYHAVRYSVRRKPESIIIGAILFGLALSSKITGLMILPLIFFFIALGEFPLKQTLTSLRHGRFRDIGIHNIFSVMFIFFVYGIVALAVVRVANPYMFADSNILSFRISSQFLSNIQVLGKYNTYDTWFPPSIQWLSKHAVTFSLSNIMFLGLGIVWFIFLVAGLCYMVYIFIKQRSELSILFMVIAAWTGLYFVYQSVQFVKVMRYFMPLYPFFAMFAGLGLWRLTMNLRIRYIAPIVVALMIWPLMFSSIYRNPHTRVAATDWMYNTLPTGSYILGEYWDDPLPLNTANPKKRFNVRLVYPFDQDTDDKWKKMDASLADADYYVLSSNRGWGSIMSVPDRYPRQSAFYRDLLAGRTYYKQIKEFTSYPSLTYMGIPVTLADDWADEAFTVYDHPKVLIFKNTQK